MAPFDIFVSNAGAMNPTDWKVRMASDVLPTVEAAEAAIPFLMKSPHAALTYIGSRAAAVGGPKSAAYGASKAALVHYMKSLSLRVMPTIREEIARVVAFVSSPAASFFAGANWQVDGGSTQHVRL